MGNCEQPVHAAQNVALIRNSVAVVSAVLSGNARDYYLVTDALRQRTLQPDRNSMMDVERWTLDVLGNRHEALSDHRR